MPTEHADLPLAAHDVIRVDSLAEYRRWCETHSLGCAIRPARPNERFAVCVRRAPLPEGHLEVALAGPAGALVNDSVLQDRFQVLMPVRSHGQMRTARGVAPLSGMRRGAVLAPGEIVALSLGPAWADLSVHPTLGALRRIYEAWTGNECRNPPAFDADVPLTRPRTQVLRERTALLFREADEATAGTRLPLVFDRWCVEFLRSTAGTLQADMEAGSAEASLAKVKQAEAWLEENLAEGFRMEALAQHIGVGMRSLQKSFKRWRGCGPLQVLKERRLERARSLLLQEPEASVQDAARRCGITHLGRFSVAYREKFGESPSETRRRARPVPFYVGV